MSKPSYVYVTYIRASAEKVWSAITDREMTPRYWGHANVSDWQPGSRWEHRRTDGSGIADVVGTVVESAPPARLVTTWTDPADDSRSSRVTFVIEPYREIVRLTVTHEDLWDDQELSDVGQGWPAVLSNLKTMLETGRVLSQAPWTMGQ